MLRKRLPESSLPLSIYTFFGLIPLDASWLRTISALIATSILLFWCSSDDARDEPEHEAWRWNKGTSQSVMAMGILSVSAIVPFALRWLRQPPAGQQAVEDAVSVVAYLIFSFSISVVIYLLRLLTPASHAEDSAHDLESLRLEHQTCISIFQTAATCMVVLFLGALLSPILGAKSGAGEVTITFLGWAFYWFAGFIVWFLRPCLDRAKAIRRQLERRRSTVGRGTSA